jgi:HEAT repeat protein
MTGSDAIAMRISQIVTECLRRSEIVTPEGVVTRRVGVTEAEMKEVGAFGEAAVAPLTRLLLSKNVRECQLAVSFLGLFQSQVVFDSLVQAAENSGVPCGCRILALASLRDAPPSKLEPVLARLAVDPDEFVRSTAAELLSLVQHKGLVPQADPAEKP